MIGATLQMVVVDNLLKEPAPLVILVLLILVVAPLSAPIFIGYKWAKYE